MMFLRVLVFLISVFAFSEVVFAKCAFSNKIPVSAALPKYNFWVPVAAAMQECGNVTINIVNDVSNIGVSRNQGQIKVPQILGVTTTNFDAMLNRNAFLPLDGLIKRYGKNLHERQFIRSNGKIVAIAIAGNTENLVVHEDLFKQQQIAYPKTMFELVEAAKKLSSVKAIKKPLALAYKNGWNVANSFMNLHLANDGILLSENHKPMVNTKEGIAALKLMKLLTTLIPENFDDAGPATVQQNLLKGEVGIAISWASSLAQLDDNATSRVSGRLKILPVPSFSKDGKPSSTLWWDGFGISIASTRQESDAAFKVMMEGLDEEMVESQKTAAIWLMNSYKPGRLGKGVIDAIERGIPRYNSTQTMVMLHTALGAEIPKFLSGKVSAENALAASEVAYLAAAKERGLVN